ncbi:MAG: hypothetical protein IT442_10935, partial [Phycisphaeraceae bacterium]|nr:hypothetical protein [Phycisphaeraceae bacterium]
VGDRNGRVGIGYAKAPGVPAAIEKAQKYAKKAMIRVTLQGKTIPHPVKSVYGASSVTLVPAAPGAGVIAGASVRAVLELAGVGDCLTKAYGSTNQKNLTRAAFLGLQTLRSKQEIEQLRGRTIEKTAVEQMIALGEKYAPAQSTRPAAKAPTAKPQQQRGGQGRGRSGGGRGRGGGKGPQHAPSAPSAPVAEQPPTPPAADAAAEASPEAPQA